MRTRISVPAEESANPHSSTRSLLRRETRVSAATRDLAEGGGRVGCLREGRGVLQQTHGDLPKEREFVGLQGGGVLGKPALPT